MEQETGRKVLLSILDKGLLAVLVGVIILSAQTWIDSRLEISRNRLAYQRHVAEQRIDKLERIWTAVYSYLTEVVKRVGRDTDRITLNSGEMERMRTFEKVLHNVLDQYGIYLGVKKVQHIKEVIGTKVLLEQCRQLSQPPPQLNLRIGILEFCNIQENLKKFRSEAHKILDYLNEQLKREAK